jgi:hypothetical protein
MFAFVAIDFNIHAHELGIKLDNNSFRFGAIPLTRLHFIIHVREFVDANLTLALDGGSGNKEATRQRHTKTKSKVTTQFLLDPSRCDAHGSEILSANYVPGNIQCNRFAHAHLP